jgi:hypothetical protein
MTFSLEVLILGFVGIYAVTILAHEIQKKFTPRFAQFPPRTISVLSSIVALSFLYQVSFLAVYLSSNLYRFPSPWADIYWVSASLAGIIFGFIGVICPRFIPAISILHLILGFGLLALFFLTSWIGSM